MDRLPRAMGAALAAACALAASLLAAAPASAAATPDRARAASYLTGSLVHGTHLEFTGGKGPNYGGTADLAVALAAAGDQHDALPGIVRYLARHTDAYVDPDGTQHRFPGPFTGSAGKLAVLAEITGQDPTAFGGVDLLHVLTSNVCTAAKGGQFGPCSAKGDFYQAFSTVGQAFGVLALARAGATVPPAALHRLIGLQCADGGFSSTLITSPSRCKSDVDSTGYAIQALALVPSARSNMTSAAEFLRSRQRADGGWVGAAGENSNSTALAVQGLVAADPGAPAAQRAMPFLAALQNGDGGFGISPASPRTDTLATTQTVPAIYHATLSRLSHPVGLGAAAPSAGTPAASRTTRSTPSSTATGSADGLARTGSANGLLVGLAAALIVVGIALTLLARSRRTARGQRH